MKRKMMIIITASLIMMALWCSSAYAEQEGVPTEPTTVEVSEKKEEAQKPAPAPEAETPEKEETPSETPAPEAETPDQDEEENEAPIPEAETPDEDEAQIETPATEDETQQDQAEAFEGSVKVIILGDGEIAYGDQVTLMAKLKDADDIEYSLRWEVDDGNGWQTVEGECESKYTFTLTEQNAGYQWRVVVIYALLETLEPYDVPLGVNTLGYSIPWVFGAVASNVCECFE